MPRLPRGGPARTFAVFPDTCPAQHRQPPSRASASPVTVRVQRHRVRACGLWLGVLCRLLSVTVSVRGRLDLDLHY